VLRRSLKLATPISFAPVVLFDGVCNLCNGSDLFIIARDPDAQFRFAALDSEAARRLMKLATGVKNPSTTDQRQTGRPLRWRSISCTKVESALNESRQAKCRSQN